MEAISTPKSLGYLMPAEWESHEATWLSWPKNELTFPSDIIGAVEKTYCRMIAGLQGGEKVKLLVDNEAEENRARGFLQKNGVPEKSVLFHRIKSADVWMRDYGPTFLLHRATGKKAAVRWIFNAWGNKYDDLLADNRTGDEIAKICSCPVFKPGIVMEGGSIDVNGAGSLLTTEQCLLNKNRNPELDQERIERHLADYLGVSDIVWLGEGIAGDDTDGHVDDFARFVGKGAVVCAYEENNADENHKPLAEAHSVLSELFETIKLPMPSPIIDPVEKRRLPASYANFYIGNKSVLLPVFGDRNDKVAIEILQSCFSGREIVPIPCRELVYGYGGIHCVTQQEPKNVD
ncbi:MAG: agmatine deiminase family protein [Candidatus Anstonellaceae archaeon]